MVRLAVAPVVALILFAGQAAAAHKSTYLARLMNVDGDRAHERIVAQHYVSFDHNTEWGEVAVFDVCRGETIRHDLAPRGEAFPWVRGIRGPRALGRPAVLFSFSHNGQAFARVVGLRVQQPGECPTPVELFSYSADHPPHPAPRRLFFGGFYVEVGEYSKRYAGRELRLCEVYRRSSPHGPDDTVRRTYFRYVVRKYAYLEFRTNLRPVTTPPRGIWTPSCDGD